MSVPLASSPPAKLATLDVYGPCVQVDAGLKSALSVVEAGPGPLGLRGTRARAVAGRRPLSVGPARQWLLRLWHPWPARWS